MYYFPSICLFIVVWAYIEIYFSLSWGQFFKGSLQCIILFIYMVFTVYVLSGVLPTYIHVCTPCVSLCLRARKAIGCPRTRYTASCELLCGCWAWILGSLEEEPVPVTPEPLSSPFSVSLCSILLSIQINDLKVLMLILFLF